MSVATSFTCKCGKCNGWIEEDQITLPCPNCGRVYKGRYCPKQLTILAEEVKSD